mmetsp:Transcript_29457/g.84297  ORF Transcript_29457/g.84297 Transcript_29457/m.84297 type:complete len:745 (-) Transcript_29457:279-2513(-)
MIVSESVEVAVVKEDGQQVLAVLVKDLTSTLCKSAASLAQAASKIDQFDIQELHDISRFSEEQLHRILARRQNLHLQLSEGWQFIEVIQTSKRRLLIAGSNKAKRKRAVTLALVAAAALDVEREIAGLTQNAHVLSFIRSVEETLHTGAEEHCPAVSGAAQAEQTVSYVDTDGDQITFKLEGGCLNYYVNSRLKVHHLKHLHSTRSQVHHLMHPRSTRSQGPDANGQGHLTLHLDGVSAGKWTSKRKTTLPAGSESPASEIFRLYHESHQCVGPGDSAAKLSPTTPLNKAAEDPAVLRLSPPVAAPPLVQRLHHDCPVAGVCKFYFEKKGCSKASACCFCHDECHRPHTRKSHGGKVRIAREQRLLRQDRTWRTPAEQKCHALVDSLTPRLAEFQNSLHRIVSSIGCEDAESQATLSRIVSHIKKTFEQGMLQTCSEDALCCIDLKLRAVSEGAASLGAVFLSVCRILESCADSDSEDEEHHHTVDPDVKAALLLKALAAPQLLHSCTREEAQTLALGLQSAAQNTVLVSTVSSCDNVSAAIPSADGWKRSYLEGKLERGRQRAAREAQAKEGDILDREGRKFNFKVIIVNFANLGNYGRREDKTARFSWDYVHQAVAALLHQQFEVFGVVKENFGSGECRGVPERIRTMLDEHHIITVPRQRVEPGEKDDLDDQATIEAAHKRCCRLLDNDMYRDWIDGKLQDSRVQKWLRLHYSTVKLCYYFDAMEFHLSRRAGHATGSVWR